MLLRYKVAVITGATKGIGETGARLFAAEGAKVVIAGKSEDLGEESAESIKNRVEIQLVPGLMLLQ